MERRINSQTEYGMFTFLNFDAFAHGTKERIVFRISGLHFSVDEKPCVGGMISEASHHRTLKLLLKNDSLLHEGLISQMDAYKSSLTRHNHHLVEIVYDNAPFIVESILLRIRNSSSPVRVGCLSPCLSAFLNKRGVPGRASSPVRNTSKESTIRKRLLKTILDEQLRQGRRVSVQALTALMKAQSGFEFITIPFVRKHVDSVEYLKYHRGLRLSLRPDDVFGRIIAIAEMMKSTLSPGRYQIGRALRTPYAAPNED